MPIESTLVMLKHRFSPGHLFFALLFLVTTAFFNSGMVFCLEKGGAIQYELSDSSGDCSDCPDETKKNVDCCFDVASTSPAYFIATKISVEKISNIEPLNLAGVFYRILTNDEKKSLIINSTSDPTPAELYFERSVVLHI